MLPLPALEIGGSSQAEEPATAFVWEAHGLSHGTSQSCLQGESSPECSEESLILLLKATAHFAKPIRLFFLRLHPFLEQEYVF